MRPGRPTLEPARRRSIRLRLNLTAAEVERLTKHADMAGIPLMEYVRVTALSRRAPKGGVPAVNRELLGQMSKLANNLNQLTRLAHTGRVPSKLDTVLAAVLQELGRVHRALIGFPEEPDSSGETD